MPNDATIDSEDRGLKRVDAIDKAVANLLADTDKAQILMNVKLERCK